MAAAGRGGTGAARPVVGTPLAAGSATLAAAPAPTAPAPAAAVPAAPDAVETAPSAGAASAPGASGAAQDVTSRPGPNADPKFAKLKKDVAHKKRTLAASHPPPRTEAGAAQDAALPPKDDAEAQGKTANAEKMNEAQPKEFDKDAFIRAVEKAIADKAPKNLDEADKFAESGKADEVRAEVDGKVGEGKSDSAQQIATTTAAPPDTSAAVPKKVVPMAADRPPGAPGAPAPANAVPDRLPPSATDLSAGPAEVNQRMADAQVTEGQLEKSNEPTFKKAVGEKKVAEQHSAVAPGKMRGHEQKELNAATAQAKRLGTAAMGSMGAQRVSTGQRVDKGKGGAKGRDEEKRAQVTTLLQGVFDRMQKDVQGTLDGLDKLVDDQFGRGEKQARDAFTAEHKRGMEEYKDRRYSGATGKLRWVRDLFAGLPAEADKIFEVARDHYVRQMRQVISDVADTIGAELNRAKKRIAQGRTEMRDAVEKLPADLRSIGREAAAEFTDKFDELTQSVDDKGTELVDTLATKYTDALKSVDDEIAAEKEKNKGLVAKAVDAVKAVINTIMELKNLLLSVLAKAAQAVMLILKDPIGFLRNLVTAVGAGLKQFLWNIGKHLQQGIMSWLLGKTSEAGIQLPAKFDTQGIVQMLASLLGLTWQNIRARVVRKVPKMEPAIAAAETAVPLVAEVRKRGVAGMWDDLKTRVGDMKKDLLDKVIAYVTPTIIQAGIMWVLSLLNPASAFVRAVKLIIDIVKFVVTQARQIFDFVNAVLDAVIAIARGGSGGVPALIENALARAVPVLLGFLASLLGIGGIAAKVKQIVQALSKPVGRAVDWVIEKIVGLVKRLWAKIKSGFAKKKPRPDKDRPRPDRPVKSDRSRPRTKPVRKGKRPGKRSKKDKKKEQDLSRRLRKGMDAAVSAVKRLKDQASPSTVKTALAKIKNRHRLLTLEGFHREDVWHLRGAINPQEERDVPDATDEELRLTDDGKTSVEERRAILAAARASLRNEAAIAAVFDRIRQNQPGRKKAIGIFRRLANLPNGYRIDVKEVVELGKGRTLHMHYFGLHCDPIAKVEGVQRGGKSGGSLGWAYVQAVAVPPTADPVEALAFDLFINPSIEKANIKGVGTVMFRLAAKHFHTEYQAVVGEWGRFEWYARGGRSDLSANLEAYLKARRTTDDPAEAARATWTYRRAREIYGGAELNVQVQELVPDIFNPPPNRIAVRAVIKPR
ncbi:phage tail protein [Streptomyces sp. NPDC001002]